MSRPEKDSPNHNPSLVVRAAEWIGTSFGRWQRQRAAARDDAFVRQWKAAWDEGCDAYRAGTTIAESPHAQSPRKDAWVAGWRWAERERQAAPSPDAFANHRVE